MGDVKVVVEPLGTDNYATWCVRMKMLLAHKGLSGALRGDVSQEMDEKASALIGLHVGDQHLVLIEAARNAKEIWTKLESLYQAKGTARRLSLRRELTQIKKLPEESIDVFVARAKRLQSQLSSIGHQVTEDELCCALLAGLPREYEQVIAVIEGGDELQLDQLVRQLLAVENRYKSRLAEEDEASAFAAKRHNGKGGGGPQHGGGGNGRPRNGDGGGSNSQKTCYYCGKKGHVKADCWKRQREHGNGGGSGGAARVVFMATVTSAASEAGLKIPEDFRASTWIVDSGATHHIASDAAIFKNYHKGSAMQVEIGDGEHLKVEGGGDVEFDTQVEGVKSKIRLRNVLHVPDMAANLVSVAQLTEVGARVAFEDASCKVLKHGRSVMTAKKDGQVYIMRAEYPSCQGMAVAAKETAHLWHRRYGHLGWENLAKLQKDEMVAGLKVPAPAFTAEKQKICETCTLAKHTRGPFPRSTSTTSRVLELVHMDVCGPMQAVSRGGKRYVATYIDDFSKMSVVRPIAQKSDVFEVTQEVLNMLENIAECKTKMIRSDRGGEYINAPTDAWLKKKGIQHQKTAPHTPEQNGVAERHNRIFVERTKAMLLEAELPIELWGEAIVTANYVRNRSPIAGCTKTPFEVFYGKKPDVSHLRVFGCTAYAHVPKTTRQKLDARSEKGTFVGYEANSKAYRILVGNKVVVRADVIFDEKVKQHAVLLDDGEEVPEDTKAQSDQSAAGGEAGGEPVPAASDESSKTALAPEDAVSGDKREEPGPRLPQETPRRTSERKRHEPYWYRTAGYTAVVKEPATYSEAIDTSEADEWRKAMDEEMAALNAMKTWLLVTKPDGVQPIPCKWVYKIKYNQVGAIERFKARLVAKGYKQQAGVDFEEIYAPVFKHTTLRTLLAKVAAEDLELRQLDIKTAFLNGKISEEIYMAQPEGYEQGDDKVCRLLRSLYGLKQAPRAWWLELAQRLREMGFEVAMADPGLWVTCETQQEVVYMIVYVDDILIATKKLKDAMMIEDKIAEQFEARRLGEAKFFLGMEIERNRDAKVLTLRQKEYVNELLEKFSMTDAKSRSVPATAALKLRKPEGDEALLAANYPYKELVGALLYISVCTRPEIAYIVGVLSRYMSCSTWEHWQAAKGVLRYLRGSPDRGLTFEGSNGLELVGYCDADCAGDIDSRRSTTGYVYTLGGTAISWASKLQQTVALSTTEAEYMAATQAAKEALWLKKLLKDLKLWDGPLQIRCDNQGAIKLSKHHVEHARSKHIDVQWHFLRDKVAEGDIAIEYCNTKEMVADCMTKAVPRGVFEICLQGMGMV